MKKNFLITMIALFMLTVIPVNKDEQKGLGSHVVGGVVGVVIGEVWNAFKGAEKTPVKPPGKYPSEGGVVGGGRMGREM
jgi:hypothetical protein